SDLKPAWTVRLSVTMPEDVIEHDGRLEGRTVTWELDESTDPTMLAVSSVGPVPWWSRVPVPLLVLVVVAGIGAVVAWRLSRGSPAQDRPTADGGFRARQAAARGGSTSKLDDMLAAAKDERRGKGRPAGRGGAPRGRRRGWHAVTAAVAHRPPSRSTPRTGATCCTPTGTTPPPRRTGWRPPRRWGSSRGGSSRRCSSTSRAGPAGARSGSCLPTGSSASRRSPPR